MQFLFPHAAWLLRKRRTKKSPRQQHLRRLQFGPALRSRALTSLRNGYEEKLGFRRTKTLDLPEHKLRIAFLELNGFTLELIQFQQSVSLADIRHSIPELKDRDHLQGFVKLGFRIPDVDALAASLKASGVKLRMEPTDDPQFHDRFLLVDDPEGNTLQFFQHLN